MNAMLQSLFHISAFQTLVYEMPTTVLDGTKKSIPLNLSGCSVECNSTTSRARMGHTGVLPRADGQLKKGKIGHEVQQRRRRNIARRDVRRRLKAGGNLRAFTKCFEMGRTQRRQPVGRRTGHQHAGRAGGLVFLELPPIRV
jgi:hypothetical protein